jgi:S-adenosylmethionine-diacylgycerolhomoserine-N-methlytransferase
MAMIADARVLLQLLRGMPRAPQTAARLEGFYAPQAAAYDRFRQRLLHGRAELIAGLNLPPGADVVELGAGTGSNLDLLGARLAHLRSLRLVDLCPSLLAQARLRSRGMVNVQVIEADACEYQAGAPVDCVIFSYSLSMIPDWRRALHNALEMLRPGGTLAIVDFTLPTRGSGIFLRLRREFWRRWFGHDGVYLDDAHLACLQDLLPQHHLQINGAAIPYLPGLRVPYYQFVGTRGRDGIVI